jgi:hypothetical protein
MSKHFFLHYNYITIFQKKIDENMIILENLCPFKTINNYVLLLYKHNSVPILQIPNDKHRL